MIKGRKISQVNVKVVTGLKNQRRSQGVALGKFFRPEKIEILQNKVNEQKDNEEDLDVHCKTIEFQEEKCKEVAQVVKERTFQSKNIQKQGQANEKKTRNVGKQFIQKKNKSQDRVTSKKQNKVVNSRSIKEIKAAPKKSDAIQKKEVKQNPKMVKIANQMKKETKKDEKMSKIDQEQEIVLKEQELESSKNQFLDEIDDFEELQSQRMYLPVPIKEVEVDSVELEQISFQNNDFDMKFPSQPIEYQSSNSSEEQDSTYIDPVRYLAYDNQNEKSPETTLEMDEQLFSLSAQELLSKEYLNI